MNILKLHEAIAVVLLSREHRKATINEIADEINMRKLFVRPSDGEAVPAYQIMQRTKLSKGRYAYLFKYIEPNTVQLK